MIKVKIYKDSYLIKGFTISGHANFKPYGDDIVCAAVSILGYTALKSLMDVCNIDEDQILYKIDEDTGYMDVRLPDILDESLLKDTQIVLNTFLVGIKLLIESYPKYIILKYRGGVSDD
ncbi:ribosomal-processing cysteine protease Prp [Paratissierella segnis]|jgi:hypothetical protein|uniref:Ribosomal processing cysteine protease Prp n=1 Tax=Paratissierella segnis TaxID=2763679 RepID=A0A926EYG6_9FIRM|nr:ribosomal-processing cysteine protease Prp [Paratissierella segnis]MBC8588832.1 ribosomal-processing cysteine protease Prp [Paratissierella segnis]